MTNYNEVARFLTHLGITAGIGAGAGGLVGVLPSMSAKTKLDKLRRIRDWALLGASVGGLIGTRSYFRTGGGTVQDAYLRDYLERKAKEGEQDIQPVEQPVQPKESSPAPSGEKKKTKDPVKGPASIADNSKNNIKTARVEYIGLGPEILAAALYTGAGATGGALAGAIFPSPAGKKKKSLGQRILRGAGSGALAGLGWAAGRSVARNALTYAANEGWI